ncbi:MAG TPA: DsbA family protein [Usitatibacter sp.]|nr:DsbA family protein [Usitatibacter sp.]
MKLLYIADPMCSWCYGFGPQLRALLGELPGTPVEVLMGGLRPFNREPMSEPFRAMLREHWTHVHEASGLPLAPAALAIDGFVYDTEPACRAVVTVRSMDPGRVMDFLAAVQAAFYRDARDVTRASVLADIAAECGLEREAFLLALESDAMREAARDDFAASQRLGVAGFPTLAAGIGEQLYLVSSGFSTANVLRERLAEIVRRVG